MLNQFFPDPETSAYADEERRQREARDREWWLDTEKNASLDVRYLR